MINDFTNHIVKIIISIFPLTLFFSCYNQPTQTQRGHLSKSSFVVYNDRDLNELRLKINLPNNVPQIYNYWISESEIVSILCLSKLGIGPWEYSEELEEKLKIVAKDLGTQFGQITTKDKNPYELGKAVYKYGNKRATMIGKKELDGKLNKDYYFPYSITSPPQHKKHKGLKFAEQAMRKSLKKQLGLKGGVMIGAPVFVYLDKNGKLESIFIAAKEGDKLKEGVNLEEFRSGGKNNGKEVKSKFVMLL